MFGHHKDRRQWERMTGRVVNRQTLPGPRAPHPKLVTVELQPDGAAQFQAEIHLVFADRQLWEDDLCYPEVGAVRMFLIDPGTGQVRFDMTDPRNCMSAHTAAGDAWAAAPDAFDDTPPDSGPPWLVAAACQYCTAAVDQRWAAAQPQPHCPACGQELIAYPVITRALRRQAQS